MAKRRNNGIDNLSKDLKKMAQNVKKLGTSKKVPYSELFTKAFMRKYSRCSSIDDLLAADGFQARTDVDIESIPVKDLDAHIAKHTKFKSWEEMLVQARDEYVARTLDF